jgi:hypothetical protein
MHRKLLLALFVCSIALVLSVQSQDQAAPASAKTPADGYTVHVTAPHMVDGKVMGPYHHYCEVHSNDPIIVCLIYDSADPNAMLQQVEFIEAKKIVRSQVPLATWNKNWHDHAVEIATGRVQVLDMPADKAKEVADLVATTDGTIFHIEMNGKVPSGKVSIPQAVGHKNMTEAEYKKGLQ